MGTLAFLLLLVMALSATGGALWWGFREMGRRERELADKLRDSRAWERRHGVSPML